mmetsp:Transcript_17000/g.38263  ORF Transcript_17000/g.38263 Transcript_17000/m.38263 type:complete len:115 (+) Transcript_17000:424-768(+)
MHIFMFSNKALPSVNTTINMVDIVTIVRCACTPETFVDAIALFDAKFNALCDTHEQIAAPNPKISKEGDAHDALAIPNAITPREIKIGTFGQTFIPCFKTNIRTVTKGIPHLLV